jgi:hypothetical protein
MFEDGTGWQDQSLQMMATVEIEQLTACLLTYLLKELSPS